MTSLKARPEKAETAHIRVRDRLSASRIDRFPIGYRAALRALADRHPYLADLAASFPGLLFALAVPRRGFDPGAAIAMAVDGRPLKAVAEAACVPMWLKRLPPEAFDRPLGRLPDGPTFRRGVGNVLPGRTIAAVWLRRVGEAAEWAGEDYALWLAKHIARNPRLFVPQPPRSRFLRPRRRLRHPSLRGMALWAWFSERPETEAGRLVEKRWSANVGFDAARDAFHDWRSNVELRLLLGEGPIEDMWLGPGIHDGYGFTPLDTAEAIRLEARAQENCLRSYGSSVSDGWARLWRVERDGRSVATVELEARDLDQVSILAIGQVRGPRNQRAPDALLLAVQRWVRSQEASLLPEPNSRRLICQATWRRFWRPYWLERRRVPSWLPPLGNHQTFVDI